MSRSLLFRFVYYIFTKSQLVRKKHLNSEENHTITSSFSVIVKLMDFNLENLEQTVFICYATSTMFLKELNQPETLTSS